MAWSLFSMTFYPIFEMTLTGQLFFPGFPKIIPIFKTGYFSKKIFKSIIFPLEILKQCINSQKKYLFCHQVLFSNHRSPWSIPTINRSFPKDFCQKGGQWISSLRPKENILFCLFTLFKQYRVQICIFDKS